MNISPTDLRISTHTATCNINSYINLSIISKYLQIDDKIKYIEHGDSIKKGVNMKVQSKKAKEKKRVFFNQITLIIEPKPDRLNNVKLFNNGAVSMTGLKNFDEGEISINIILNQIKHLKGVFFKKLNILTSQQLEANEGNEGYEGIEGDGNEGNAGVECKFCKKTVSCHNVKNTMCNHYICNICSDEDHIECKQCNSSLIEMGVISPLLCKIKDYKIVLINSDYYLGFEIKRNVLHELLLNEYNTFSSYEPCIYPGVNSKYYFNKAYTDKEYEGKCYCDVYCNGAGNGDGNGACKKVTVAIFQSGSIIITGARNMEQIECAHKFINGIIDKHYHDIKRDEVSFLNINEKKKTIKLKKNTISNYPTSEQLKKLNILV
jgi:TATA-box binding protein (TBP) (component of TFIID and TFIIIB)